MKYNRTGNSIRNITFGFVNKIVMILLPFIVRTVFIRTLGVEYLGLNSLFNSILTVLNLTELGFSSAVVFCMYKPIAENDRDSVNALLAFFKKVYLIIGIIILAIGSLIIPFLTFLIKGDYPTDINLTIVYIVYLLNTSISYFLFGYLSSIISAHQREDFISKINLVVYAGMYGVQIVLLLTVHNYYAYIATMPLFTIFMNLWTAIVAKKYFPEYKPIGTLSKDQKGEIREKINGLVISKVCYVSRNAFDSIFISMFLGLVDTAIYNNYYYIMNAVVSITTVLTSSILAGVGNSIAIETVDKNYEDMRRIEFLYMWISGWFTVCMLCLYQPFMKIWVGETLLYPITVVIMLCIYFYVLKMSDVRYVYEQATGLWWECRFRSILEVIGNIVLNYALGKIFGVYGIIAATIITIFFINYLYGSTIIFKFYYKDKKIGKHFSCHLFYMLVTAITGVFCYFLCSLIKDGGATIIIKIIICLIIPNFVFFIAYFQTPVFKNTYAWLEVRIPILRKIRKG